ncbi:MAG TPA: GtrA family protein [Candidatus Paceibacterota bacterium]|nr:GtrA family protein [Candidatus Paceibacterota bacterium]
MMSRVATLYYAIEKRYPRLTKIARYLVSGGTAATVDLVLLYAFTEWADLWYLLSSVLAFIIAFGVSFVLQKFWTFQDHDKENMHVQAGVYLAVAVMNLTLNTFLVFFFVQHFGFHYLFAQIFTSALIAVESFFVYQRFIFRTPTTA